MAALPARVGRTTTPARPPPAAWLGKRQIDEAVLLEAGIERDVEQSALAADRHLRHALDGRRQRAVTRNDTQPAGALGHQQAAIGQELEAPGMLEAFRERLDLELGCGSSQRSPPYNGYHQGQQGADRSCREP